VQCPNLVEAIGYCLGSGGTSSAHDQDEITTPITCAGEACPRTPGFWTQQCAQKGNGSTKFTKTQVTNIASCIDDRSSFFNWSNDFDSFCITVNPPTMNQRVQAKRQFATLLANFCTDQLLAQRRQRRVAPRRHAQQRRTEQLMALPHHLPGVTVRQAAHLAGARQAAVLLHEAQQFDEPRHQRAAALSAQRPLGLDGDFIHEIRPYRFPAHVSDCLFTGLCPRHHIAATPAPAYSRSLRVTAASSPVRARRGS
jgi:hypothetical protein